MWKITPLHVGSVTTIAGGLIMKHGAKSNPGELVQVPHIAWLLEDASRNRRILVDTGSDNNNERNSRLHNPVDRSKGKHIVKALEDKGLQPGDIDAIIVPHLHWITRRLCSICPRPCRSSARSRNCCSPWLPTPPTPSTTKRP